MSEIESLEKKIQLEVETIALCRKVEINHRIQLFILKLERKQLQEKENYGE